MRTRVASLLILATTLAVSCRRPAPPESRFTAPPLRYRLDNGDRADLTFGAYNLHGLAAPDRLRRDLSRLEFVDAWAFQEVTLPYTPAAPPPALNAAAVESDLPATVPPPEFETLLPPGRWHLAYVPVNPVPGGRPDLWEGQAIASRFPIRRAETWVLDRSAPKHRVALAAWFDTPRGEILFVNADHEIGGPADFGFPGPADRTKQVVSLTAMLRRHADTPTVVAGDFNTAGDALAGVPEADEIAALNRAMTAAGLTGLGPDFDRTPTFRFATVGWHLDHLFLRHLTADAWDVCTTAQGSDHYPVWCRVRPAARGGT
jgi:endonuclease/exonuclease/phosphatase family metal-dependent hydrolase